MNKDLRRNFESKTFCMKECLEDLETRRISVIIIYEKKNEGWFLPQRVICKIQTSFAFSLGSQQLRKIQKWQPCWLAGCDWKLTRRGQSLRSSCDNGCHHANSFSNQREDFGALHSAGNSRQAGQVSGSGW